MTFFNYFIFSLFYFCILLLHSVLLDPTKEEEDDNATEYSKADSAWLNETIKCRNKTVKK